MNKKLLIIPKANKCLDLCKHLSDFWAGCDNGNYDHCGKDGVFQGADAAFVTGKFLHEGFDAHVVPRYQRGNSRVSK